MTRQERLRRRRRIILRRRILLGVAIAAAVLLIVLLILHIRASLEPRAAANTLTVNADGTIVFEEITGAGDYDTSDMRRYVRSQIRAYNDDHDRGAVKLARFAARDGSVYVRTEYKDASTYSDFTGYRLTTGTIQSAMEESFSFDGSFVSVKDGVKGDSIVTADLANEADDKLVTIQENTVVVVDGSICYVTDESTTVTADNTVAIAQADGNPDATTMVYIVYQ